MEEEDKTTVSENSLMIEPMRKCCHNCSSMGNRMASNYTLDFEKCPECGGELTVINEIFIMVPMHKFCPRCSSMGNYAANNYPLEIKSCPECGGKIFELEYLVKKEN